jgi:hypothetical protein
MTVALGLAAALFLGGAGASCAGPPAPSAQLSRASAAVVAAARAGSGKIPWARLYLERASAELLEAMELVERGKYDLAEGLLLRAEADAELARAKASELKMSAEAERAVDRLRIPSRGKESHVTPADHVTID